MPKAPWLLAAGTLLALAGPAAADDSGTFFVRLGRDTTGVEHYSRTASRIEIDQVGRVPRVLRRHFVYDLDAKGDITKISIVVTRPGAPAGAPPIQTLTGALAGDSLAIESRRDTTVTKTKAYLPPGTVLVAGMPWTAFEGMSTELAASKADSLRRAELFLGLATLAHITVRRFAPDSVAIETATDRYRVAVDKTGRIQHVTPIFGTQQYTVDRVSDMDLDKVAADFLAREQAAGQMGALSTRDTVKVSTGGAALWIDYGRPARRGRSIFGMVVPFGRVWRTGANAATQFKTDKALQIGATTVPAGFYTLWTIPEADGWKLVVNSETGQWGTEHKPEKDLYTVAMTVSPIPQPVERFTITVEPSAHGGVLNMDWDTTRASVPFIVKP